MTSKTFPIYQVNFVLFSVVKTLVQLYLAQVMELLMCLLLTCWPWNTLQSALVRWQGTLGFLLDTGTCNTHYVCEYDRSKCCI